MKEIHAHTHTAIALHMHSRGNDVIALKILLHSILYTQNSDNEIIFRKMFGLYPILLYKPTWINEKMSRAPQLCVFSFLRCRMYSYTLLICECWFRYRSVVYHTSVIVVFVSFRLYKCIRANFGMRKKINNKISLWAWAWACKCPAIWNYTRELSFYLFGFLWRGDFTINFCKTHNPKNVGWMEWTKTAEKAH